jgi:hypothetical protein
MKNNFKKYFENKSFHKVKEEDLGSLIRVIGVYACKNLIQLDTHQDNFFTKPTTWSSSLTPPLPSLPRSISILKFVTKLIFLLGNFELSRVTAYRDRFIFFKKKLKASDSHCLTINFMRKYIQI